MSLTINRKFGVALNSADAYTYNEGDSGCTVADKKSDRKKKGVYKNQE